MPQRQGVTKRCRLSWLTNIAFVYLKCGERGEGLRGLSQWVQLCTWSQNKLRRSNSIPYLAYAQRLWVWKDSSLKWTEEFLLLSCRAFIGTDCYITGYYATSVPQQWITQQICNIIWFHNCFTAKDETNSISSVILWCLKQCFVTKRKLIRKNHNKSEAFKLPDIRNK